MKNPSLRIAVAVMFIAAVLATMAMLPVRTFLREFLEWVHALGAWGPALLVLAYVVASVLFVPGLLLSLGAGFLFGVPVGTIAVSLGGTLGATAAFLVGRTLLRESIKQMVANDSRFVAIDGAVAREGFKIVLLCRLSPVIPFNLINFALGLTQVSMRDFVLASWMGMLPATIMYVVIGSTLADLAEIGTGNFMAQQILFALGLVATIAVTIFITRVARQALRETVDEMTNPRESPVPPQ